MLFVANFTGNNITGYANPGEANGNVAPTINLAGAQTQVQNPWDVVVDNAGSLVVVNHTVNRLSFFTGAATANGNREPARLIQGAATQMNGPNGIAHAPESDVLFVANAAGAPGRVNVFDGASQAGTLGNLAPARAILSNDIAGPFALSFSLDGSLYVANTTTKTVSVFANAVTLNGTVPASRIISSPAFVAAPLDVKVALDDTMFVLIGGNKVAMFLNSSTLNGAVQPDALLTITGASGAIGIEVDSVGRGYICDQGQQAVFIYDALITRNGTFAPDRTIKGVSTQLGGPFHMFLSE